MTTSLWPRTNKGSFECLLVAAPIHPRTAPASPPTDLLRLPIGDLDGASIRHRSPLHHLLLHVLDVNVMRRLQTPNPPRPPP